MLLRRRIPCYRMKMKNVFTPQAEPYRFLRDAQRESYSMSRQLVRPAICKNIIQELEAHNFLEDMVELENTEQLRDLGMTHSHMLHASLVGMLAHVEPETTNPLPQFSVRVFEPGEHSTTIHRNHPSIGPWAIGITLEGTAPFNIYRQDQLSNYPNHVLPLYGDSRDPTPEETLDTSTGSAWTLYTRHERIPHSGGLVSSDESRKLIIFYDSDSIYAP